MDLFGRKAKKERLEYIARREKEEDEHTKRIESLVKLKPIEILEHIITDDAYQHTFEDGKKFRTEESDDFFETSQRVILIENKLNFTPEDWELWYSISQYLTTHMEFRSLSTIFLDKAIEIDPEHWELWLKKAEYLSRPSKRCVKKIESENTGKSKYQVASTENPKNSNGFSDYDTPPLCNNDEIFAYLDRAIEMNKEIFEAGEFKANKLYSMGNRLKTNEESLERISKCHECCDEMIVNILKSWVALEQKGKEISYANKENWQFDCMTYFNKAGKQMAEFSKFVEIKVSCYRIVKNDEDFFRGFVELQKKNEFVFNSLQFCLWEELGERVGRFKEEERRIMEENNFDDAWDPEDVENGLKKIDLFYDDLIEKCHVRIIHP